VRSAWTSARDFALETGTKKLVACLSRSGEPVDRSSRFIDGLFG